MEREGKAILDQVSTGDELVLLDVAGVEFSSTSLAAWIEKKMVAGTRQLVFAVGGPYGFSEAVYKRADSKLSLSRLTFPHQLVRLLFIEQLYRAMTIIRGEPYHHA
jgi:23S rRNA (pseudouridine1915-N3)-methyltransferase